MGVIFEAYNNAIQIEEALVELSAMPEHKGEPHASTLANHLKLVRELLGYFEREDTGEIVMTYYEGGEKKMNEVLGSLGTAVRKLYKDFGISTMAKP